LIQFLVYSLVGMSMTRLIDKSLLAARAKKLKLSYMEKLLTFSKDPEFDLEKDPYGKLFLQSK
jgi:hypothetical protein